MTYLESREETGTFYYNAIKDWNGLQDRLKISSNLLSFKSKLKQYMQKLQLISQRTNLYFVSFIAFNHNNNNNNDKKIIIMIIIIIIIIERVMIIVVTIILTYTPLSPG